MNNKFPKFPSVLVENRADLIERFSQVAKATTPLNGYRATVITFAEGYGLALRHMLGERIDGSGGAKVVLHVLQGEKV